MKLRQLFILTYKSSEKSFTKSVYKEVMSCALRLTASSVTKLLKYQNVIKGALPSVRNAVSQVKFVDRSEDTTQEYGKSFDTSPSLEHVKIHMQHTGNSVSINMESVPTSLQKELLDNLGLLLNNDTEFDQIPSVTYNFVSEEVYRNRLYMPFRRLGYKCVFTRYNHDKGLASFKVEEPNDQIRYSYYRSGLPNSS